MLLVVGIDDHPRSIEYDQAVVVEAALLTVDANHHRNPVGGRNRRIQKRPRIFQKIGDRRFRPEDEVGPVTSRGQIEKARLKNVDQIRVPFVRLRHVRLHEADHGSIGGLVGWRRLQTKGKKAKGKSQRPAPQARPTAAQGPHDGGRQKDGQKRQAMRADPCRKLGMGRVYPDMAQEGPRKAGEEKRAKALGQS